MASDERAANTEEGRPEREPGRPAPQDLVECRVCGELIARESQVCVHCGAPFPYAQCPACGSRKITVEEQAGSGVFNWLLCIGSVLFACYKFADFYLLLENDRIFDHWKLAIAIIWLVSGILWATRLNKKQMRMVCGACNKKPGAASASLNNNEDPAVSGSGDPSEPVPAAMPQVPPAMTQRNATKKCPACAETIKAAAVKCRYCGNEFDPARVAWENAEETREQCKAALSELLDEYAVPEAVSARLSEEVSRVASEEDAQKVYDGIAFSRETYQSKKDIEQCQAAMADFLDNYSIPDVDSSRLLDEVADVSSHNDTQRISNEISSLKEKYVSKADTQRHRELMAEVFETHLIPSSMATSFLRKMEQTSLSIDMNALLDELVILKSTYAKVDSKKDVEDKLSNLIENYRIPEKETNEIKALLDSAILVKEIEEINERIDHDKNNYISESDRAGLQNQLKSTRRFFCISGQTCETILKRISSIHFGIERKMIADELASYRVIGNLRHLKAIMALSAGFVIAVAAWWAVSVQLRHLSDMKKYKEAGDKSVKEQDYFEARESYNMALANEASVYLPFYETVERNKYVASIKQTLASQDFQNGLSGLMKYGGEWIEKERYPFVVKYKDLIKTVDETMSSFEASPNLKEYKTLLASYSEMQKMSAKHEYLQSYMSPASIARSAEAVKKRFLASALPEFNALLAEGDSLYQQGRYDDSINVLTHAKELAKQYEIGNSQVDQILINANNARKAEETARATIAKKRSDLSSALDNAQSMLARGMYEQLVPFCTATIEKVDGTLLQKDEQYRQLAEKLNSIQAAARQKDQDEKKRLAEKMQKEKAAAVKEKTPDVEMEKIEKLRADGDLWARRQSFAKAEQSYNAALALVRKSANRNDSGYREKEKVILASLGKLKTSLEPLNEKRSRPEENQKPAVQVNKDKVRSRQIEMISRLCREAESLASLHEYSLAAENYRLALDIIHNSENRNDGEYAHFEREINLGLNRVSSEGPRHSYKPR
ncbi:MAG: zinc ribbon domain-containing protein [Syntrophobacter sp.]